MVQERFDFCPHLITPKSGVPALGEMKMVKGAFGIQLGNGWYSVCVSALCACVWCVLEGGGGGLKCYYDQKYEFAVLSIFRK